MKSNKNYNKLHYLEDIKISQFTDQFQINNIMENLDANIMFDPNTKDNCIVNHNTENDIVLKHNFLFAVVNIDLANELNLAAIFVDYIKKENWKLFK